ncbi:S1/P1 nuclease [Thalassomonas haliotis]|uniref:S1/P1 nuclease n=1 Tax=Thalassomonas haliotis TaxID=485448 RepID=A0ABY7VF11_9GAMM|nr:S1/P1 nuclease [Thalassomonas haliotis]WDE11606.1 S1/P1 nuclease [Thalassomonas haliotis]
MLTKKPLKKILMWLLPVIFLTGTFKAFALGKMGHQLVCQLSYDHLTPASRQKITQLLTGLPQEHKEKIAAYTKAAGSNDNISFADACLWADAIKKDKAFDAFKPWHYLNVDRDVEVIGPDACKENCVTRGILFHQQQLSSSNDNWQKLQALMFLGHWLGDIHQPLHISYASDLGGNRSEINSTLGKCSSMHWLWDDCLLTYPAESEQALAAHKKALLAQLGAQWQSAPVGNWQKTNVWQWATESLEITRQKDVGYCRLAQNKECKSYGSCKVNIGQDYQMKFTPVLQQRILQAAVRLNILLEQAL